MYYFDQKIFPILKPLQIKDFLSWYCGYEFNNFQQILPTRTCLFLSETSSTWNTLQPVVPPLNLRLPEEPSPVCYDQVTS